MVVLGEALFLAVSLVAAVFAGSSAQAEMPVVDRSLTIVIRPAVNLAIESSGEVTLADIVDVATIPAEERVSVIRHLQSVGLTDRPKPGDERTFTQEGLEAVVGEASRRLEAAGYTVEWKIPRRSHIIRKNTFSRESVTKALTDEFRDRCSGCEVSITRLDLPNVTNLKIQTWRLNPRAEKPRGSFAAPIDFEIGAPGEGATRKTLMVTGQAAFYAQVPIATRALQGGEKIANIDFKVERKDITFALDAVANTRDFETSVTSRSLAIGEAIWKGSLRREQIVRFGDPVRVVIGGETWSVTSDGVAQGPAALGESIRVKVGKSQKLVSGVLKEKSLVEVQ